MKTKCKILTVNIKHRLIILFVMAFGFTSCTKDDDSLPQKIMKSSEKQITSFMFLLGNNPVDIDVVATIDEEKKTILATMPIGCDITALIPEIGLSAQARVDHTSVQDFTKPVAYTVTAEDGSKVIYMVTIRNHIGVYTLTSILSGQPLDPDVTGTFNDVQLIDNVTCTSTLSLHQDNTFSFGFLKINQNSNSSIGVITSYEPITCMALSQISGQFKLINGALSLDAPPISSDLLIRENLIQIIIRQELIIDQNGFKKKELVDLTFSYEK
ncbi:hypothetical protein FGM00_01955 [Aggregatimonas sangjinii]|uniref:DUF5018 domain-containing protein n=1 Tax=Aggregatimonas sangjinii TaxID=2583587 RepID=A0A5B7SNF1_9FLAO|nr:hypothetical protein [Aggregatimonas sangjinii]QCW98938.1 hypothetical protein FGM00_01955 [Aggregatimonas sangjinii]